MHDPIYPSIRPSITYFGAKPAVTSTHVGQSGTAWTADWQQQVTHNMTKTRPNDISLTNRGFDDERNKRLHIDTRSITKYLYRSLS